MREREQVPLPWGEPPDHQPVHVALEVRQPEEGRKVKALF